MDALQTRQNEEPQEPVSLDGAETPIPQDPEAALETPDGASPEAPAQEAAAAGPDASPGAEVISDTAASAVVPVGTLRQESQKTSFWRRIRLGRPLAGRSGLDPATGADRIIARLDAIESRVETSEHDLVERIQQLDERFTEVWEVEEQLSRLTELHEMVADLQERQGRIDSRLRAVARRLSFITLLAATAAGAALVAAATVLL